jgi:hypothetical protein
VSWDLTEPRPRASWKKLKLKTATAAPTSPTVRPGEISMKLSPKEPRWQKRSGASDEAAREHKPASSGEVPEPSKGVRAARLLRIR